MQPPIEAAAEEATKGSSQEKEVAASHLRRTRRADCDANKVLVAEKLEVGQPQPRLAPDEDPGERPSQEGVLESLPVARGSLGGGVRSQGQALCRKWTW
jgi:hypothetical protein